MDSRDFTVSASAMRAFCVCVCVCGGGGVVCEGVWCVRVCGVSMCVHTNVCVQMHCVDLVD